MRVFFCVAVLFVVGCGSREIDREKLVERNGLSYEVNSETPFTGVSVAYAENGQKIYECHFKYGKKNGVEVHYRDNGQKSLEFHYDNGVYSREPKWWDDEGKSVPILVPADYISGGKKVLENRDDLLYYTGTNILFSGELVGKGEHLFVRVKNGKILNSD